MGAVLSPEDGRSFEPTFGGCKQTVDYYRMVGAALLRYEQRAGELFVPSFVPSQKLQAEFSTDVAFVRVEVLESFLDDLLDLKTSDESLFVRRSRPSWRAFALLAVLCGGLIGSWAFAPVDGLGLLLPASLFGVFVAGAASVFYFVPRARVFRRFVLAKVLSQEIARRRGSGSFSTRLIRGPRAFIQDLIPSADLIPGAGVSLEGAPLVAGRYIVH
jgi:hypothetical protein